MSFIGLGASGGTEASAKRKESERPQVLLVDTNITVAAADDSAKEHEQCVQLLDEHDGLTVTAAVVGADALRARAVERAEVCQGGRSLVAVSSF